ncbi:NINE protein [Crocosphaera sp. Alani8]|uniref:NINE protein n=1 Tax=Crocosphaera sp. Alani8 TaxID=3038952 RepID=UPI00313DCA6B
MQQLERLLSRPKDRKIAILLALVCTILPWPIAGVHKFYTGQPVWGIIYLLLWNTPIPSIACAIDAVWYFVQGEEQFNAQFNSIFPNDPHKVCPQPVEPLQMNAVSEGLRELDKLREEGLVSDYEFEQKRRKLLDRIN